MVSSGGQGRGRRARFARRGGERLKVAVLMGGQSAEHDVSLTGGAGVMDALAGGMFELRPVVITRDGHWRMPRRSWAPRARAVAAAGGAAIAPGEGFDPHDQDGWREMPTAAEALVALREGGTDVVLPVLHGRFGEDGTLQANLTAAGLAFVGSDMKGSVLAFDKVRTKEILGFHRIPTPRFDVVPVAGLRPVLDKHVKRWKRRLGLPLIVKDPCGGSSLEVRKAHDAGEIAVAVEELGAHTDRLLVEELIYGRELTLGVLETRDHEGPRALPVVEILPNDGKLFDYHEKYAEDGAQEICPADLSDEVTAQIQALGLRVHTLLGLRGLSRTDIMLANDGTPYVLEVNTLPGMTSRGLVPLAASKIGLGFADLLETLILQAS